MLLLLDFLNVGLFCLYFATFYFLVQRFKTLPTIINLRILPIFTEIIEGLFLGLLFYLFDVMIRIEDTNFEAYFLTGYMVLCIYRNSTVGAFSLLIPLILYSLTRSYSYELYTYLVITFLYVVSFNFLSYFSDSLKTKLVSHALFLTFGLTSFLVIFFLTDADLWVFVSNSLPFFYGFILLDLFLFWIGQILVSANVLNKSVYYDFAGFYKPSVKSQMILNQIKRKKTKKGFFGIFKIDFKKQISSARNSEIQETVLSKIQAFFPDEAILFKVNEKNYGFFMSCDLGASLKNTINNNFSKSRPHDDVCFHIEEILQNLSGDYETSFATKVSVDIMASVAFYGVQSCSLVQLENYCLFTLNSLKKNLTNRILVFNPNSYAQNISQKRQLLHLENVISLDDFGVEFIPVYNLENKKTIFNYPEIYLNSETNINYPLKDYFNALGISEVFYRYFANEILKSFAKFTKQNPGSKILVPYPVSHFNRDFKVKDFLNKIRFLNVDPRNIIIDVIAYKSDKNNRYWTKAFEELEKEGVEFSYTYSHGENTFSIYNRYNYKYTIYKQGHAPEKVSGKNSVCLVDKLPFYSSNIQNVGGKLFQKGSRPALFGKNSQAMLKKQFRKV